MKHIVFAALLMLGIMQNSYGADVLIKLENTPARKIKVVVSARQYMLPKPEIAGGVLYQIGEKLK